MRVKPLACVFALVTLIVTVFLPASAEARVPGRTPTRRLASALSLQIAVPEARGSVPGVLVTRGATTIFAVNPDTPLPPASLLKLATTATALLRFGPNHRFATRVLGPRPASGTVSGDVTLVGGGDPTLATTAWANKHYQPHPNEPGSIVVFPGGSPTVEGIALGLRNAGVRHVTGNLRVDDSLFDSSRTQPGWPPTYTRSPEPDVGYISALTVNEGFADLEVTMLAPSPALQAGGLLRDALRKIGVRVDGTVVLGRAAPGSVELALVQSPPLSRIVFWTNRWSVNGSAEMLLKGIGATFGGRGTTAAGVALVRSTMTQIGIPLTGFTMVDGSGLSPLNRATARMMVDVVQYILADSTAVGVAMRDSMPVAGAPGTLFSRMRQSPTKGNLRGKTGLITHVRCMTGWVTGSDGVPIVYVAIFSGVARALALNRPLDVIGQAMARFPVWPFLFG